jgi:hypothetical protein
MIEHKNLCNRYSNVKLSTHGRGLPCMFLVGCRNIFFCKIVKIFKYVYLIPVSRPTDATCDRLLFSIYMCITLHVSSVKRSSSGFPRLTYSLQFLCLCLSAALSCKKLRCICWSTYWNIWRCTDRPGNIKRVFKFSSLSQLNLFLSVVTIH